MPKVEKEVPAPTRQSTRERKPARGLIPVILVPPTTKRALVDQATIDMGALTTVHGSADPANTMQDANTEQSVKKPTVMTAFYPYSSFLAPSP
ncbi:hypothetical protein BKA70DRAFT_1430469 [Coprinopsis sp. MPI-PUGE-AT-0042]|nr:hypothetical protein BKA70DRAFT_1430469 [Coprinopsis sp. MPI-PUGE-AT-0042]